MTPSWFYSTAVKGNWQSLYRHVNSLRQSPAFVNRERIWRLALSLRHILSQVNSTSLRGDDEGLDSLRWIDAYVFLSPADIFFSRGSWAFHHRSLAVSPGISSVSISFVEIYSRRYISAIRLVSPDGKSSTLGYQHPRNEFLVSTDAQGVAGFHLAQDERGIRGVAVLSTSGSLSEWAGDHVGIPVRKLALGSVDASRIRIRLPEGWVRREFSRIWTIPLLTDLSCRRPSRSYHYQSLTAAPPTSPSAPSPASTPPAGSPPSLSQTSPSWARTARMTGCFILSAPSPYPYSTGQARTFAESPVL